MNGGLATRFGQIKATHDVAEFAGRMRNFLELKIGHVLWAGKQYGGKILYGLMNSPMTDPVTQTFLDEHEFFGLSKDQLITYVQSVLRRKVPREDDVREYLSATPETSLETFGLARKGGGDGGDYFEPPQWAPAGHFDAVAALVLSRALGKYIDVGVEYIQISNIDNLAATVEPAILGMLADSREDLLVEVALKKPGDRGGVPVSLDSKGIVLMEEFALPEGFDAQKIKQFNTATYWIKLSCILQIFGVTASDMKSISDEDLARRVRRVREKIPTYTTLKEVDGMLVVQDEQLLGDLTRLYLEKSGRSAAYLLIDTDKRFIPIKTKEDLIKEASRIRGILQDQVSLC